MSNQQTTEVSTETMSEEPTDGSTDRGGLISTDIDAVSRSQRVRETSTLISARDINVYYGENRALQDINLDIPERRVTALIGPSGCGKSTFLRCINRMNDLIDVARVEGTLELLGKDVYEPDVDPVALRRRVGMVFQKPNPFPKSIYENVTYGLEIQGVRATTMRSSSGRCGERRCGMR